MPFSSITAEDLAQTGEPDLESLRRRAAHAGPIDDDTFVYRVEFHVVRRPAPTVTRSHVPGGRIRPVREATRRAVC